MEAGRKAQCRKKAQASGAEENHRPGLLLGLRGEEREHPPYMHFPDCPVVPLWCPSWPPPLGSCTVNRQGGHCGPSPEGRPDGSQGWFHRQWALPCGPPRPGREVCHPCLQMRRRSWEEVGTLDLVANGSNSGRSSQLQVVLCVPTTAPWASCARPKTCDSNVSVLCCLFSVIPELNSLYS